MKIVYLRVTAYGNDLDDYELISEFKKTRMIIEKDGRLNKTGTDLLKWADKKYHSGYKIVINLDSRWVGEDKND